MISLTTMVHRPAIEPNKTPNGSGSGREIYDDSTPADGDVVEGSQSNDASLVVAAQSAVDTWAMTNPEADLDGEETLSDRFASLVIAAAIGGIDVEELSEDQQDIIDEAMNCAGSYLLDLGASQDDVNALIDGDEDAAIRVKELIFPEINTESGSIFDASYKKVIAFKDGEKVIKNRRVSGSVHRTAKQKQAQLKMTLHSHNATANMRRAKSMRARQKAGK